MWENNEITAGASTLYSGWGVVDIVTEVVGGTLGTSTLVAPILPLRLLTLTGEGCLPTSPSPFRAQLSFTTPLL